MPSAKPFLLRYRDNKITFAELLQVLAEFRWKRPSQVESVWGVDDPAPLGEEGTVEEIALAAERGWITLDEEERIYDAIQGVKR